MSNHQKPIFKFLKPHIHLIFNSHCCICGYRSLSNHIHHIDSNSLNNDAFNFAVLCEQHHKFVHSKNIIIELQWSFEETARLLELNNYLEIFNLTL